MKQSLLLLGFCLAFSISVSAQNTHSGNNPKEQKKDIRKRERQEKQTTAQHDKKNKKYQHKQEMQNKSEGDRPAAKHDKNAMKEVEKNEKHKTKKK